MNGARSGFTLTELLIVMAVSGIVMTALLNLVFSSQRMYQADMARVAVNQNASVALTAMTNDLRQAGERMTRDVPALLVSGSKGSETITMRRSILDAVLPVCKDVKAGTATDVVFVSKKGGGKADKYPDGCKDTSTELGLDEWKAYRIKQGGKVDAYIYDPVTKVGEMFVYDAEDNSGQHIHRGGGKWLNDYEADHSPRLYIMEEVSYQQDGTYLTRKVGTGDAVRYLPGVTEFDIQPFVLQSGTPTVVTGSFPTSPLTWKDLYRLDIVLTAQQKVGTSTGTRTFTSSFVPRNVFSEDR
ncbi:type II secretion system protein [Deinococcus sedimenti]|uniref:Prepilin-type N-terminal cleavage/methylation domain-containing protein n=1 Tax=Deinococcus sedimenti TaxID=1867090 RepID=A0ABQ2S944_9DEIO|nr:type II secretion system protein [Deinococcus sedimenti]GGS10255.1 hypothetical protein GCM10008960_40490 [Deinococcus sedimenti]